MLMVRAPGQPSANTNAAQVATTLLQEVPGTTLTSSSPLLTTTSEIRVPMRGLEAEPHQWCATPTRKVWTCLAWSRRVATRESPITISNTCAHLTVGTLTA